MQFSYLLLISLLLVSTTAADSLPSFPHALTVSAILPTEERADLLLESFREKTKVAGVSVSVSRDGNFLYSKGFGYANVEQEIDMEPSSQIRTASVAKVITATALGKLATDGLLDFDQPLGHYIAYLKEPFATLTARQIAGHTAGIPHRPHTTQATKKHYETVGETLSLFEDTKLLFVPDTAYEYSTLGYNLLAILIEEITGSRYEDYLKQEVFIPLNMLQTFPENIQNLHPENARSYFIKKGKLRWDKNLTDGSYKLAGAGFRSTSSDLTKMMSAYHNGFLSEEVVEAMFTTNTLTNGEQTQVGIAWRLSKDFRGRSTVEHAGAWQGARTVLIHYPKEQLTISIMINTKCTIFIEETAHAIAQLFLEEGRPLREIAETNVVVKAVNHRSDGEDEYFTGRLILHPNQRGELQLGTDRSWLHRNEIFCLSSSNDFVLSTSYGLLYLEMERAPKLTGRLFLYQAIKDAHHTSGKPMLSFEETN